MIHSRLKSGLKRGVDKLKRSGQRRGESKRGGEGFERRDQWGDVTGGLETYKERLSVRRERSGSWA